MTSAVSLRQVIESAQPLAREEACQLMQQLLAAQWSDADLAALLLHLNARGETAAELAGFVDAMRAAAVSIPLTEAERKTLVDTCGTGGDASGTFNISTAAALVAAAAGATVAKHGNRAVTSKCGSADVLEALGIPVSLSPDQAAEALRRHRFAFLHAPSLHPAMKAVMPVRRALGVRTVFNVLGPLANPAGARAQVMGVYAARLVPLVADAMHLLDVRHAFVVHGDSGSASGMDELSISGPSQLAEVRGPTQSLGELRSQDVGLQPAAIESLYGGDAGSNAEILRRIFAGEPGPRRDVVLLNAAAVLIAAGVIPSSATTSDTLADRVRAGITLAVRAIDSGAVTTLVSALASSQSTRL